MRARAATTCTWPSRRGFHERGYHLGHVTGHSIGMTMIEFPKVGEGVEIELQENMVLSMHPHAIAENGEDCLYMQDTWLVTPSGGVPLADLAMEIWVEGARRSAGATRVRVTVLSRVARRRTAAGTLGCRELAVDRAARDRHRHRRRRGVAKVRASRQARTPGASVSGRSGRRSSASSRRTTTSSSAASRPISRRFRRSRSAIPH